MFLDQRGSCWHSVSHVFGSEGFLLAFRQQNFWIRRDPVGTLSITFLDQKGSCWLSVSNVFGSEGITLSVGNLHSLYSWVWYEVGRDKFSRENLILSTIYLGLA